MTTGSRPGCSSSALNARPNAGLTARTFKEFKKRIHTLNAFRLLSFVDVAHQFVDAATDVNGVVWFLTSR